VDFTVARYPLINNGVSNNDGFLFQRNSQGWLCVRKQAHLHPLLQSNAQPCKSHFAQLLTRWPRLPARPVRSTVSARRQVFANIQLLPLQSSNSLHFKLWFLKTVVRKPIGVDTNYNGSCPILKNNLIHCGMSARTVKPAETAVVRKRPCKHSRC
jgi:hypothetical protein